MDIYHDTIQICDQWNNKTINYMFHDICRIKDFLTAKTDIKPKIGIICGSGLGSLADNITKAIHIDYKDIPNFLTSTVEGHKGMLIFGYINEIPVICMQGRFHYYEGYSLAQCIMPIKLMKLLGVSYLIASNAAGGVNSNFRVGDIMLQNDHLNIMGIAGNSSLRGLSDNNFGQTFFSMTKVYDPIILQGIKNIVLQLGLESTIREGVYTCMGGPNYETVAEVRMLKNLGIDAVGMSTVHEVIAARYWNIKCFAFSLITNICNTEYDTLTELNSEEVIEVGKSKEEILKMFVKNIISYIGSLK